MTDPTKRRALVRGALNKAEAAGFDIGRQIDHAARVLLDAFPEMSDQEALGLVRQEREMTRHRPA